MITAVSILANSNRIIDFLFILISLRFLVGFCLVICQLFGRKPFKKNMRYNILIILVAIILVNGTLYVFRKARSSSYQIENEKQERNLK